MKTFSRPLPQITIPPRCQTTITSLTVSPKSTLHPVGITISKQIADSLFILDIKVGRNSQLVAGGTIPGSLFSDEREPVAVRMDRLTNGLRLSLIVENTLYKPANFSGTVICSADEPPTDLPWILGLGQTEVNETASVKVFPQMPFEPTQLHVPSHLIDVFEIVSIEAEKYLDSDDAPRVDPNRLSSDLLQKDGKITIEPNSIIDTSHPIVITVRNKMSTPRMFQGAILGLVHPYST